MDCSSLYSQFYQPSCFQFALIKSEPAIVTPFSTFIAKHFEIIIRIRSISESFRSLFFVGENSGLQYLPMSEFLYCLYAKCFINERFWSNPHLIFPQSFVQNSWYFHDWFSDRNVFMKTIQRLTQYPNKLRSLDGE